MLHQGVLMKTEIPSAAERFPVSREFYRCHPERSAAKIAGTLTPMGAESKDPENISFLNAASRRSHDPERS